MKSYTHLLSSIEPIHYQVDLEVDLKKFTFSGHEIITFKLKKAGRKLTFHSDDLKISLAELDGQPVKKTNYDKSKQTVTFELASDIPAGKHSLQLKFSSKLNKNLHGFYRSQYTLGGTTKHLATTQFEPTHAREAFICIDEPAAKATFEVSLTADKDLAVISNTNTISEAVNGKSKTCQFATTPKMSTYLLAFIIGDFKRITASTKSGVEIGVCTTPDKIHQAEFALSVACRVLEFYEDYFGIAYPLPKLDMIAIPDFSSGAMENWGAVTYRETAILVDPVHSSLSIRQWAAMVIAHELAHQWFGNLVTMSWWTDLWLNEGFASWIEYLAVDHLFPDWQMWDQFVADDYQQARRLDCLASTHPIEVEVHDPGEINEIFDAISYQKGASVIRMLYEYLGEADFKRGLHNYLSRYSYGNTVTRDLWDELGRASGKPVEEIMGVWTKQAGYPLVILDENGKVTQKRFYTNLKQKSITSTVWPIPLSVTTRDKTTSLGVIKNASDQLSIDNSSWIKPNSGQAGFFITRYSTEQLAALHQPLSTAQLSAIDRFGIMADISQLNEAGLLGAEAVLEAVTQMKNETNYIVWDATLSTLGGLIHITTEEAVYKKMQSFMIELLAKIKDTLGLVARPNEHYFDSLLRPLVLSSLGRTGEKDTVENARNLLNDHIKGQLIAADLRTYAYVTVARNGSKSDFEALLALYKKADSQEEQRRLFAGLANFKQADLIDRALTMCLSNLVRPQDSVIYLRHVIVNRYACEQAWQFIQDNWSTLKQRYEGGHLITHIPAGLGQAFVTKDKAAEVQRFFASNTAAGMARSVEQAIEQIRVNDAWRERDRDAIKNFLKTRP